MTQPVLLLFADSLHPREIRELASSMGAEQSPDPAEPYDTVLERDGARVWVDTFPPGDLPYSAGEMESFARVLGVRPRCRVILQVSRERGSEWLAAEFVLAAAERWSLVVEDFGGAVLTGEQFQERVVERSGDLFRAVDRGWWAGATESVVLLFPDVVDPEAFRRSMKSLGATVRPDEKADAQLCREGACVRARVRPPGSIPIRPDTLGMFENALGAEIRCAVELDVADVQGAEAVAMEVIEALAARWEFVIEGFEGQVVTVDGLRMRAASGTAGLFRTEG